MGMKGGVSEQVLLQRRGHLNQFKLEGSIPGTAGRRDQCRRRDEHGTNTGQRRGLTITFLAVALSSSACSSHYKDNLP